MILAIDGPAGVGKSTTAIALSKSLGWKYFDSGSVYRSLTYISLNHFNFDPSQGISPLLELLRSGEEFLSVDWGPDGQRLFFRGSEITSRIRSDEINKNIKYIADEPNCREFVNDLMRSLALTHSMVVDGRDIGTKVFPYAEYKVFLTAAPEVRAGRRAAEKNIKQGSPEFNDLVESIRKRDLDDENRAIAPLKPASDAVVIDTSHSGVEAVVKEILSVIEKP